MHSRRLSKGRSQAWKNYSAIKLETMSIIWSLDSLSYYLVGCSQFTLWTNHNPLAQAMRKTLRDLTQRIQKFCKAIQAYNVKITHVKGIHNKICNALSRAPVGSHAGVERVLNNLRGHAYNRIITLVKGNVSPEVLEDPALDELWEEAELDKGYQRAAKVVADKVPDETIKTLNDHPIKEYRGANNKLSVIEMLMLRNSTRIVIPDQFRVVVLEREHISHAGTTKMYEDIGAKYLWPGMAEDIKRKGQECIVCQEHENSHRREPMKLALEFVDWPMQSIGHDFFQRYRAHYFIMMDRFSGLPMFQKMSKTTAEEVIKQMKL